VLELLQGTGFANLSWQQGVMIGVAALLLFLAIVRGFEPLLLGCVAGVIGTAIAAGALLALLR
jgi:oxaloacetate decarboxylase beta subunit